MPTIYAGLPAAPAFPYPSPYPAAVPFPAAPFPAAPFPAAPFPAAPAFAPGKPKSTCPEELRLSLQGNSAGSSILPPLDLPPSSPPRIVSLFIITGQVSVVGKASPASVEPAVVVEQPWASSSHLSTEVCRPPSLARSLFLLAYPMCPLYCSRWSSNFRCLLSSFVFNSLRRETDEYC
eukprot:765440-Hanusia_phi.AAC.6